jgi:hypothetical protein
MSNKGIDIGTNMLVAAYRDKDGAPMFKMQRDAYYKITPKSTVNSNSIRMSLEKRGSNFLIENGDFIVVGDDALEIAIERNDVAMRPLKKGIISPKEKDSLPMLKLIIKALLGEGDKGDKVFYSIPAVPVDGNFDIVYHREIMGLYLKELGYNASPLNESFAIALSELLDEGLTGVCLSYGAGMTNIAVLHQGDSLIEFSVTRSGDFIDQAVGNALDMSPSLVQLEKEAGVNLLKPTSKIMEAVAVYYNAVINYTLNNIVFELNRRQKKLPLFKKGVPMIVSGGLTLAEGFTQKMEEGLKNINFPIPIGEVRRAKDPMKAVANGCLLASYI